MNQHSKTIESMTSKEKADDLIDIFYECKNARVSQLDKNVYEAELNTAIINAMICVNEIINQGGTEFVNTLNDGSSGNGILFWNEVKEHISNIKLHITD